MKRVGFVALLLLTMAACSHRQAQPPPSGEEAALTGIQTYPRAYPVALPAEVPIATAPPTLGNPATGEAATAPFSSPGVNGATAMNPAPAGVNPAEFAREAAPDTTNLATLAPAALPDGVVVLDTSFGHIVIQLDDVAAPKTCANFRKLVATGFYDGTIFHRVIPHFIIQGGDPYTKGPDRSVYGLGDPGYTLPPEIGLHHDEGAVAMARLPDTVNPQRYSNGSQFYICVTTCPSLDDHYTVFGHVLAGLDVANRIATVPTDRRSDPLERITLKAKLESRKQALRESATTAP